MTWPNLEKHHGHASLVFGCGECLRIRDGWTCHCGCPNAKLERQCRSCSAEKKETKAKCTCTHARDKHDRMIGACKCGCKQFMSWSVKDRKLGA